MFSVLERKSNNLILMFVAMKGYESPSTLYTTILTISSIFDDEDYN